jgi:hypothetical protein
MAGELAATAGVAPRPAANAALRDRRFFTGMGIAIAAVIVAGFAPTYFFRSFADRPPLRPFLHLHGIAFTAWVALFVAQTSLIATRRTALHRRMGLAALALLPAMAIIGLVAARASAARGFSPPGAPPPLVFLVIPFADIVLFVALAATGLALRRRLAAHKRLMLLATIALLPPATGRLAMMTGQGLLTMFIATDAFVIAMLVYDRWSRGRFHPATVWGGLALVASQPLRLALTTTAAWMSFARWFVG